MTRSSVWTPDEDAYLIAARGRGELAQDIGAALGRSEHSVLNRIWKLRATHGKDAVPYVKHANLADRLIPIDGHDYNPLYDDVPWPVRITGRDQRVGITA